MLLAFLHLQFKAGNDLFSGDVLTVKLHLKQRASVFLVGFQYLIVPVRSGQKRIDQIFPVLPFHLPQAVRTADRIVPAVNLSAVNLEVSPAVAAGGFYIKHFIPPYALYCLLKITLVKP
jgi:hypothetical protein